MDSVYGDRRFSCRVSPFGYPRIDGYMLLPAAFRSLSRPSSAPGARASTLRPYKSGLFVGLFLRLFWNTAVLCFLGRSRFLRFPLTWKKLTVDA